MQLGPPSAALATALFDALEPVDAGFMLGSWRGEGFPSQHPLDGVLEAYHWHGKRFDSAGTVHPLVFCQPGGATVCVNPLWLAPALKLLGRIRLPRTAAMVWLFQRLLPLLRTSRPRATLRMHDWHGKCSAAMVYDQLPVQDVFRKVDDNLVLGLMDYQGMDAPYFFVLRREHRHAHQPD